MLTYFNTTRVGVHSTGGSFEPGPAVSKIEGAHLSEETVHTTGRSLQARAHWLNVGTPAGYTPQGDHPQNWQATDRRTSGHQHKYGEVPLLFTTDGDLTLSHSCAFVVLEVGRACLPSRCWRSWAWCEADLPHVPLRGVGGRRSYFRAPICSSSGALFSCTVTRSELGSTSLSKGWRSRDAELSQHFAIAKEKAKWAVVMCTEGVQQRPRGAPEESTSCQRNFGTFLDASPNLRNQRRCFIHSFGSVACRHRRTGVSRCVFWSLTTISIGVHRQEDGVVRCTAKTLLRPWASER